MKFCGVTDINKTFRPHPKTLVGDVGMDKKKAFDKIRLLAEISKVSNQHIIIDNTEENQRQQVRQLLSEMRIFSSAFMEYAKAALSKEMS